MAFPKIEYGGGTNWLNYPSQFDNAAWTKTQCSVTGANAIVAPDGTLTADRVTPAGAATDVQVSQFPSPLPSPLVGSTFRGRAWLKAASGTPTINFFIWDNIGQDIVQAALNTGWQRFSVIRTSPSGATSIALYVGGFVSWVEAEGAVDMWGAELYFLADVPSVLQFKRPNRFLPRYLKEAVRHDTIASGGAKQSILERLDQFLEFDMPWIAEGADAGAWEAFLDHALAGGEFDYYPDADLPALTRYTLENMDARLTRKTPGEWAVTGLRFRKAV